MSLWPSVLFSLARTLLVIAAALPAAAPIARRLREEEAGRWWAATLAPLLVPELLTGYGWSNFSLSLAANPWANEALTTALIWGRCVCAAAALLAVAPAPRRTASAVFLRKLLVPVTPRLRGASALRGWVKEGALRSLARLGPAAGLAGLYAFGQFEVPSLAGTTAWTVTLFDAHARMISLADSLRLAWPAAAVQLVGLIPLLIWLRGTHEPGPRDARRAPPSRGSNVAAAALLAVAAGITVLVPAAIVAWETGADGWAGLAGSEWRLRAFAKETGLSLALGIAAAACAAGILWLAGRLRGAAGVAALVLLVTPGLCGPLVIALCVQAATIAAASHGWPGAGAVRGSFAPAIAALTLFLLPRAAALRAFAGGRTSATFLAASLRLGTANQRRSAGRLWWRLRGRSAWVRWGLLALWAAADVAAAKLLLPPGYETASPGLYNLMHYGHNAILGALCLANTLAPALLLAAGAIVLPRVGGVGARFSQGADAPRSP